MGRFADYVCMSLDAAFQGSLFANDFLCDSVAETADWQAIDDAALDNLEAALRAVFDDFPFAGAPNESQTEDDLIWPVLGALGWTASLRQQNLSAAGMTDVPDGLLFADEAAKGRANALAQEWRRYELGLALVESKRWRRPLDRRSGRAGEETAPSTQMLRYLRRVDDLTAGALRWGILTNGARWRLYYQGARSVSEQFFEVDLPAILDLPGHNDDLFALDADERRHARGAPARGTRGRADPALPAALHPLRRGPRPAAGPRRALPRLAGGVPRRVDQLAERGPRRWLRRRHRRPRPQLRLGVTSGWWRGGRVRAAGPGCRWHRRLRAGSHPT